MTDKPSSQLQSMTGFADSAGDFENLQWSWEVKSINAKGMDIRFRLPSGYERIEPMARKAIKEKFHRGTFFCGLSLQTTGMDQALRVNEQSLEALLPYVESLSEKFGTRPSPENVLNLKGVIEVDDNRPDLTEKAVTSILDSLLSALDKLIEARQAEGNQLSSVLEGQLTLVEKLAKEARQDPHSQPETITKRLEEQIAPLLDQTQLEPDRLHQEAIILAMKADITEELDRLDAHICSMREIFKEGGAVGRKLDFLMQEFNREANTLCSKSNAVSLTSLGLQMKTHIDQMREQIQNIE